ncbi:DNA polymerase III subunit gamma/tau [bacterium]|jgi:DNA polymerase III subunit gamma/tau|nr:DNA polymerase III subunit gamma/tau [bacterium]
MSHITLYRKYRSQRFDELIGQEHIVTTLSNAIEMDRLAHATIFSGPRGTGKTSTARILAKSLNCEKGPSVTPCLECGLCKKITHGTSVDVIEIDAASNTGVDNIRDLNEQVNFMPVECRTKIYIIDEVHMLSTGAFNALLKTLEEPPAQTIFILATTEPHKIPVTIHSRCQSLHFRRLKLDEITGHLSNIATKEGLQIDEAATRLVAQNSQGCMRDALSLLDQIRSFKGNQITGDDVQMILGTSNVEALLEFVQQFLSGDQKGVLQLLKKFSNEGLHVNQLTQDIANVFRSLIFVQLGLESELDFDDIRIALMKPLAAQVDAARLLALTEAFSRLEMDLRWYPQPDVLLQLKTLVLMSAEPGVAPAPRAVAPPVQQAPRPAPVAQSAPVAPPVQQAPVAPRQAPVQQAPAAAPVAPAPVAPPVQQSPVYAPVAPTPPVQQQAPVSPAPAPVAVAAPEVKKAPVVKPTSIEGYADKWQAVLGRVTKENRGLAPILTGSFIADVTGSKMTIRLGQEFRFFLEKLKDAKYQTFLGAIIKEECGFSGQLAFEIEEGEVDYSDDSDNTSVATDTTVDASSTPTVSGSDSQPGQPVPSEPVAEAAPDAAVAQSRLNQIVEMFEGSVV